MGIGETTSLDPAALRAAAQRLDTVSDFVVGSAALLGDLRFDGSVAGRAHAAAGDAVRTVLDRLAGDLGRWAQAAGDLAVVLRSGADRHVAAESHAATVMR